MKQTIRLFIFLALAVLATNNAFAYDFEEGDWGFYIMAAGEVECFCINKEIETADIPQTTSFANKQFSVTEIGFRCFENSTLKTVNIPNTIRSIGSYAFSGCKSLTEITIPTSVTTIGDYAFSESGLTSISLPPSITSIGPYAFYHCTDLAKIDLPTSLEYISSYMFADCLSLQSIYIPDNITSIKRYAFSTCRSLPTINLPESVTYIGESAFEECTNLSSANMPGVKKIGVYAFDNCLNLVDVHTAKLETIDFNAFKNCKNLKTFTFPPTTSELETSVFSGCNNLTDIYCYPATPPKLSDSGGPFDNIVYKLCNLHVPQESVEIYKTARGWDRFFYIFGDLEEWTGVTDIINETEINSVSIISINGESVYSGRETEIPELPKGIYIKRDNKGHTSKFIIK